MRGVRIDKAGKTTYAVELTPRLELSIGGNPYMP